MLKIVSFVLGVICSAIGLAFMFLYTNMMSIGYSFLEFVKFISSRVECYFLLIGIILILVSFERWIRDELLLRHTRKHE